jgi:hypothetical protein
MKTLISQFGVLVLAGMAVFTGCATVKRTHANSVAVAVTTSDGRAPSPAQVSRILTALGPELTRAGFQLSRAASEADFVVTVKFTADAEGNGGEVSVAGIEPNGRFSVASGASESEDTKELRRRLREIDAWAAREMTRTDD